MITKEKAPPCICKFCGSEFQSRRKAEYCSPRCVRGAKGDFLEDQDCVICGTRFHPQRAEIMCCSLKCGKRTK
jgi:hypothetical protein